MATASEIKAGMDAIAERIAEQRAVVAKAKSNAQIASDALNSITIDFADVLSTIDSFAANSTDYFERLAKAEKAKLQAEFVALVAEADAIVAV